MRAVILYIALTALTMPTIAKADVEFGLDFNVLNAIVGQADGNAYISGTVSASNPNATYEVAIPFFYHEHIYDENVCCFVHIKRVDVQLRKFKDNRRLGPYLGILVRHSNVSGRDYENHNRQLSYSRNGIGAVFGVKTKIGKHIHWGANFNIGKFQSEGELLANGSRDAYFFGPSDNGNKTFFNIEFLKLGVRF